jgi:hypothetical protein
MLTLLAISFIVAPFGPLFGGGPRRVPTYPYYGF